VLVQIANRIGLQKNPRSFWCTRDFGKRAEYLDQTKSSPYSCGWSRVYGAIQPNKLEQWNTVNMCWVSEPVVTSCSVELWERILEQRAQQTTTERACRYLLETTYKWCTESHIQHSSSPLRCLSSVIAPFPLTMLHSNDENKWEHM
jgi:hypothetical protein